MGFVIVLLGYHVRNVGSEFMTKGYTNSLATMCRLCFVLYCILFLINIVFILCKLSVNIQPAPKYLTYKQGWVGGVTTQTPFGG